MKILKIVISILVVVLAAVAVWNKILLDRCTANYRIQSEKTSEIKSRTEAIQNAVIKAQSASMKHIGKTIKLTEIEKIFPIDKAESKSNNRPKVLLIFSELGCNVCQDEETRFAVSIASEYGTDYVMAVVHAKNQRYARNYIRLNQVNFPVYFTSDDIFFNVNGIRNTPMIFVINESNRVIASHFPIPGHQEYSEPMHQFCYGYFNDVEN